MSLHSESGVKPVNTTQAGRGAAPFVLKRLLAFIETGRLTVITPKGRRIAHAGPKPGPEATIEFHSWRPVRRLLLGGDIGFAESYFDGEWSTPDIAALIELAALNVEQLDAVIGGSLPFRLFSRLRHKLRANTKAGSRKNISFHYDLGNEFYRLWLDRGMTYSSALYGPGDTLETAQDGKLRRIVELLDLKGEERILEIGCGWGTLAKTLALENGHVTGLTLSAEQLAFARASAAEDNLQDRVDLRLKDYRDQEGQFDRIVSIEMIEAVGEQYWPVYFETLRKRLKPGGRAVIQAITIHEDRFEGYRRGTDFIQRYVFPGGMLMTDKIIDRHARDAGLELTDVQMFGDSYALTLAEWRRRFLANWPQIEKLGFNARFRRLWEYYLGYCEGGFRAGTIDVGLFVLKG